MAIRWHLQDVLNARRMTALELARDLGVTHPAIYRLAKKRTITRITVARLDALCRVLECQPGDLLTYSRR